MYRAIFPQSTVQAVRVLRLGIFHRT